MANEVKRWKATMLRDDGNFQEIEVVDAKDHERIVAAKDAEIERMNLFCRESEAKRFDLNQTIAELKRAMDKLIEMIPHYEDCAGVDPYDDEEAECTCHREIDIERALGAEL